MRRRYHTEAKSFFFVTNATFTVSIYILPSPNRPPLVRAIRRAASHRRDHTITHSTSPVNLHSLVPLYYWNLSSGVNW